MSAAPSVEMSAKGVSPAATTTAAASAPARGRLAALYHFADNTDYALIASGCLFKLAFGATQGFVIVIFGDFFDISPDKFYEAGLFFMMMMGILGVRTTTTTTTASPRLSPCLSPCPCPCP